MSGLDWTGLVTGLGLLYLIAGNLRLIHHEIRKRQVDR
jgi:hypothetical protein